MFQPKSDAIQIKQDNFKIPCRNGVTFTEDGIIRFEIPRNAGFVDLANTYLEMEVLITNPNDSDDINSRKPALQLDRMAGAQNLIHQLTIRSEGRVLEELRSYNIYANLHYNATLTDGAMNRRSRLEGCAPSYLQVDNPYTTTNQILVSEAAPVNAGSGLNTRPQSWKQIRRKVCLPLLGGLFTNPRSHPAMVMPLEVEIILEKSVRVCRIVNRGDGVIDQQCVDIPNDAAGAPGSDERRRVWLEHPGAFGGLGGATAVSVIPPNGVQPAAGQENISPVNICPYRVGQYVRVNSGNAGVAFANAIREITSIHMTSETHATPALRGKIMLTFDADIIDGAAAGGTNPVIYQLDANNNLLAGAGTIGYQVQNPRLVVAKVVPPPAVVQQISTAIAKGQYNQDIISYTNVDNAIPATQSVSTNILSVDLSRVKSILSVPCSQANTELVTNSNYIQGQWLHATEYEYQIDNKLQPDRRVPMTRELYPTIQGVEQAAILKKYRLGNHAGGFHRYEVEKALRSANIAVKNLNFITNNPSNYLAGGNTDPEIPVAGFNQNAYEPGAWLVGRSLGAGVGTSQNLVAKSCLLYLNYNPLSNMVKLLRNFLVHIRTISVSMNGVSVYY